MAVFFKGMTPAKTAALTRAMMASGDCFSHRPGHPQLAGKHSTGGPADLRGIVLDLAREIAGIPHAELERLPDDDSARRRFDQLVAAQAGNSADLPRLAKIHKAPLIREVIASAGGTPTRHGAGEGDRRGGFRRGIRPVGQMWRADPRGSGGLPDPRPHGGGSRHGRGDDRKSGENLGTLINFPCCQTREWRFRFRPPKVKKAS